MRGEGRAGAEKRPSARYRGVILTLTYVRSVSTSSQMTLRSLSASESCLGVAGGGKGESGLGEEETHSEGFISCRLRQKAATCSVLCEPKTGTNKRHAVKRKPREWATVAEAEPGMWICRCYFHLLLGRNPRLHRERAWRDGSKKKVHQFGLFSVIYNNGSLPPPASFHIPRLPDVLLLLTDFQSDSSLSLKSKYHTHMFFSRSMRVAVETNADADWITPDKNRPHLSPASTAAILVLTTDPGINTRLWQTI